MATRNIKTAFIGLGQQGGPMAERMLAAGFPLAVWARRAEALETYVAHGAEAAKSIEDLGNKADHVGVCIIDDAGVMAVCETLIPAMRPGSLLAIHSTILPQTCEALDRRCAELGIGFLDAPVSGGGGAASAGKLTVMCGGAKAAFEQAKGVLESFAATIAYLGAAGSGQRAKIVNNSLMAANMGLGHAALAAGEDLGLDRNVLAELIKVSSGRSFGFEVYARLPEPSSFKHGAPLLVKDVDLLRSILPNSSGAQVLQSAASPFLEAATAKSDQRS